MKDKRIVIIGGTSGIGLATARLARKQGAKLVITGRNDNQLKDLQKEFGSEAEIYSLDISDERAVKSFFEQIGPFDYLTTPGSEMPTGPFLTMETAMVRKGIDSKFLGQYNAAKYGSAKIRKGGAIVLFSGFVSHKPQKNLALMAAVNSGVEGLGRALAIELGPIRVNTISPGIVNTPRWNGLSSKKEFFEQLGQKLPVQHVGEPEELAEAVLFLLANTYTTGQTLFVEGGNLWI